MGPCRPHLWPWPPIWPNAPKRSSPQPCAWPPASIGDQHRQHSLPNPVDTDGVKVVLSGLARQGQAGAQRQAKGISREALAAIRATACRPRRGRGGKIERWEQARARGQVDIALCCLMFDGLLRRSEAAMLRWTDIGREADGSGRLTVRRSKTDQEGEGKVLWVSPDTMDALSAIRRPSDTDSDPVFGLAGQQISRRIAAACETAGLGQGYSGHSLRVGAAQALAGANISPWPPSWRTAAGSPRRCRPVTHAMPPPHSPLWRSCTARTAHEACRRIQRPAAKEIQCRSIRR